MLPRLERLSIVLPNTTSSVYTDPFPLIEGGILNACLSIIGGDKLSEMVSVPFARIAK
jgi:hypothetical protein